MAECVSLQPEEALEKLRDQVTCAICLQSYTQPKVLQCLHVFCKDCLQKLVVKSEDNLTITCAICRKETSLSGNRVSGLQSAFHMNNLLEIESGLQHLTAVRKAETTDNKPEIRSRKSSMITCLHHRGEEISLFCETCTELICIKCTVHLHNGHKYDLIRDAFQKTKEELIQTLEPAEVNLNQMKRAMSKYSKRDEQIAAQRSEIEGQIQSAISQLQEVLDSKKEDLLSKVQSLAETKQSSLKSERNMMETLQSQLVDCVEKVQHSLEFGSPENTLMGKEVHGDV